MLPEALDTLYLPTDDAAADVAFYRHTLGGRIIFAIEAMNTRVAEVALATQVPAWSLPSTWPPRQRSSCTACPTWIRP